MPQLDFFSISNQFFWGIFYFFIFYIIIELYVVPTLFVSIFAREHFSKSGSIDSFDTVYYSFIAFNLFSQHLNEYANFNTALASELETTVFNLYFVFDEAVTFEINNFDFDSYIFEELDNNN